MRRVRVPVLVLLLALAQPAHSFAPTTHTRPRLASRAVRACATPQADDEPPKIAELLAANAPAAPEFAFDEDIAVPYMQQALRFQWPRVLFFAANPLIFVPIAAIAALVFRLPFLHVRALFVRSAAIWGAGLAVILLAVLHVLERFVPALVEVTRASKTITLYAMGPRLLPLRALGASAVISLSAAVGEEVAFRGVLMAGLRRLLLACALPARAATAAAIVVQAVIFGKLHSYTSSGAYWLVAAGVGLLFGLACATTGSLAVAVWMHFCLDLTSFAVCHFQVSTAGDAEQLALVNSDSPVATMLRGALLQPYGRG